MLFLLEGLARTDTIKKPQDADLIAVFFFFFIVFNWLKNQGKVNVLEKKTLPGSRNHEKNSAFCFVQV